MPGMKVEAEQIHRLISLSPAVHYICTASADYGATFVSEGIKAQLGYERADFTQDPEFWASRVHPEDRPQVMADMEAIFENDRHVHEYRFLHANGSWRWMHDEVTLVRDEDGNPREMVGSWLDVTARKEAELALAERNEQLEESKRQLEYLALYDPLTGLGNRSLFLKQLEQLIAMAGRKEEEVALLVMDLDGFKDVNDRLGHAAGDVVLGEFGARLSQALRQADQKFRIGGDEFAVLLEPRRESLDVALAMAEKVSRHLTAPMEIKGHGCSIGVSIGIAVFPRHGRDPNALIRKADAAMYEAKKSRQVIAQASDLDATTVLEGLHSET